MTIDRRDFLKLASSTVVAGLGQVVKESGLSEEPTVQELRKDSVYILMFEDYHCLDELNRLYIEIRGWLESNGLDPNSVMVMFATGPVKIVEIPKESTNDTE